MGGIEIPPRPPVMGWEKLAEGCQCQSKWPSEGSVARKEYSGATEDGASASFQGLFQARRWAAEVHYLGAYPIASKHL